ncbi:MAG TPA: hypothetical protein VHP11_02490, partial [Tepidisphaeraceae bacterium]|nr:hypothetical protein [Tepidisphaeraceae bacterium]
SAAAAAPANKRYKGLSLMLNEKTNADGSKSAILSNFSGQAVTANDILVKYTWNGDVDLNGKVDLADYFLVDAGFIKQTGGYRNGDLDLNGKVGLADYFLIDAAFIGQDAVLATKAPSPLQQLFSVKPVL